MRKLNSQLYIKRKEKRLKQKEVAEMLGIHKQSYYLKENGKREFTISEAKKLAKIFDCTLDELFGKEN